MEPAVASAILAKLEAITRQWEVINERLDHMGVPREQVGYPDTRQDEDCSSCGLRGKNVIPYTHMNVVAVLPSVGVHESSFCDTLDIVRSYEDQTLVVGTQALVDPLDDEIDSPRENDLCSSGSSTYNLTKVPLLSDESINILVDPYEKQAGASSLFFVYSLDYARTRLANDTKSAKKGGERRFNVFVKAPAEKDVAAFVTDFLMGGVSAAVSNTAAAPIERVKLLIKTKMR
ncbi:hypothetical protein T459_34325 [Capsicum annuum]|uniref:ADP/ATP translocase n=1 Tax=Capsicum annuum TaxID=4072 RepID=A0A2G2XWN3_CAPAN|nr:hypothetical protein T459_34325 [Capsicum annuum]